MPRYYPTITTYHKGYAIQRIGPNHFDLWSRVGVKTQLNPSGRTFIETCLRLCDAKCYVDRRTT